MTLLSRLRAAGRATRWTHAQHVRLQRTLRAGGTGVPVSPPPRLPAAAVRVVLAVLRVRGATCLERSLLLQAWFAARGQRRDVVIGVRRDESVLAHAWLDGLEDGAGYVELHRLPA